MKARRRHSARKGRRGFSLLEAVIAAAILGIGLVGLAELHVSSLRGTVRSEEMGRGAEVARELADVFSTLDYANLPNCGPGPTAPPTWVNPPGPGGCRDALGVTQNFNAPRTCTTWFTGDGVPNVNDSNWVNDPLAGDGSPPDSGNFRVDVRVSAHPDTISYPSAGQGAVSVLWVWVCWRDDGNHVQELSASRIIPANM